MWYQRLDVLWDGAEYLALAMLGADPTGALPGILRVRSATTSADVPRLVAVLPQKGPGERIHVVRLPSGHRFLTVSPESPNTPSVNISLEEQIPPGNGTEWRLVLFDVSASGEPGFDSAAKAAPYGSAQDAFEALRSDRLRSLGKRKERTPRTIIWGVRCIERRVPAARAGRGASALTASPVETVYPEATHIAPVEIEPIRLSDQEFEGGGAVPDDMLRPVIVQTIAAERGRRPVYGLRLRTSREDPFAQWVQRRSAIVHFRRQVLMGETTPSEPIESGPRTLPFNDQDIDRIGQTPEEANRERIDLVVPANGSAIRACSLSQVLSGEESPIAGITMQSHRAYDMGTTAPADQTILRFDGAVLGDDIGLVSTQAGALKQLVSEGPGGEATDIMMFRVTPEGLKPTQFPEPEKLALVRAAARVQPSDAGANAADDHRYALGAARRALDQWYSEKLGTPVSVSFNGIEPVLMWYAVDQLACVRPSGSEGVGSLLTVFRDDPALYAVLIAYDADIQTLKYVAEKPARWNDDLLIRIAEANDVSGLVAANGVVPDAELEALSILHDIDLRRQLLMARISLDSSTRELRVSAQQVLSKLADRAMLTKLASSLEVGGRQEDAVLIANYLRKTEGREWTPLSAAVNLAQSVDVWLADSQKVDEQIEAIGGSDSTLPASASGMRRPDEIRENIRKVLAEGLSASDSDIPLVEVSKLPLEKLDYEQLLRLESKVLTLVYGPARDRLINDLLEKLETWARLPLFFVRLAESEATELPSTRDSRSKRRRGAELFKERVEKLQGWDVPKVSKSKENFTRQRIALRTILTSRRVSEIGVDEAHSGDFEQLVIPVADLFLHHLAFLRLRIVSATAQSQKLQDDRTKRLARDLARGLYNWPHDAEATWKAGVDLASVIVPTEKEQLESALELPTLS